MFDGLEDVSNSPKRTFQLLKNKNYLPNLSVEQRLDLEEKAKIYLRPQIEKEFKNYMTYIEEGKDPPIFDFELAKEVMTETVYENMIVSKTLAEDTVDDIKFLHNLPNQDLDFNLTKILENVYKTYPINVAKGKETFLKKVVEDIKSDMKAEVDSLKEEVNEVLLNFESMTEGYTVSVKLNPPLL